MKAATAPTLGAAVPRRPRSRPSAHARMETPPADAATARESHHGMRFGSDVHACFQQIDWCDGGARLPDSAAGRLVASLLEVGDIAEILTRPPGHVTLHREQPVDAIMDRRWITGVVDRMHVHREAPGGRVTRVEIIDFKTDAVAEAAALIERHAAQMRDYRTIAATLFPGAEITTTIVSTALRARIPVACE